MKYSDKTFVTFRHPALYMKYPSAGQCKCPSGYKGRNCENACERGRYGINCAYRCQCEHANADGCHPVTGECVCKEGWRGETQ